MTDIRIESYDRKSSDYTLLQDLDRSFLYHPLGILKKIYRNPVHYCYFGLHVGVLYVSTLPVSVCLIAKDHYFGWDQIDSEISDTYGLINFFTVPRHRRKGFARKLFTEFDNELRIRRLCVSQRARHITSHLPKSDALIVND